MYFRKIKICLFVHLLEIVVVQKEIDFFFTHAVSIKE